MDRSGTISKPLGDVRVRQALNYAVDRKAIAKALYGDEELALSQYALTGQAGLRHTLNERVPLRRGQGQAAAGRGRATRTGSPARVLDTTLAGWTR